ncbi:MAG: UDP-N-acetylmuramoyl-L-alanine--D-glutamate ligase [Candidatus Paceibacterota bacterium]|jgi:UDP-N-acetylmuramoylalanine--D-glutamate ligase
MRNYKEFFNGKKVTMLGLGLLGRGLNDAKFLAECGAILTITDLKTKEQLEPTIKKLAKYKNIKYVLGEHRLEDFRDCDFVLKAAGVPLDSIYIEEAKKNKIPVEMDESLFAKCAPNVKVVGITGTRGKTTTTYLIYEILKLAFPKKVHLGGNIKGLATLPLLKKVKEGDIVVMELSSWQLQGWGEAKICPNISVFTNLMDDHLNYYKGSVKKYFEDKAKIYTNQNKSDYLICGEKIFKQIGKVKSKKIISKKNDVPKGWKIKIKGDHNLENISYAIKIAEILGVPEKTIKKAVENFGGVEGRQEFLREYKGVKIYNDTTATTPDATIAALNSFGSNKNIVLIMGGADKNLDMGGLIKEIPKYCKKVILLAGTGTEKLGGKVDGILAKSLKEGLLEALKWVKKGDILILSPGFASFGMFKNEFDRGKQFVRLVKALK